MTKRKAEGRRTVIAVVAVGLGLCATAHAQQFPYAVFDLGTHGTCSAQSSYGFAVNEWGQVAADACTSPGDAFIWFNGHMTVLPPLTVWSNGAHDINDQGIAVGNGYLNDSFPYQFHAALWQNSTVTDLGTLGGLTSFADGVNEKGEIVGSADDIDGVQHPVIWRDESIIDLGLPQDALGISWGMDINESSQAVGFVGINHDSYAFVWQDGVMTFLKRPEGAEHTEAYCINDAGYVGGVGTRTQTDPGFAILWNLNSPDTYIDLQAGSGFSSSSVNGINNVGTVVGDTFVNSNSPYPIAFISDLVGPIRRLDQFLPPKNYWILEWAYDVNDAGQITGVGINKREQTERGYLLTPVHPTLTLAQPSPGKAGQRNTLTLTGATPGARIYFVYGTTGGGAVVPGCDLQEAAVQIDNPKVIGFAIANASGVATLSANVPLSARNAGDILIQAVDPQRCVQSQLVVEVFE